MQPCWTGSRRIELSHPRRGEVWLAELNPTRGREQAGKRPVLVVSQDIFNGGPAQLVMMIPLTTTARNIPLHVEIKPLGGGLKRKSFAMCENLRSISRERMSKRLGSIDHATMREVEDRLRVLLDL
jgi:mRNA interferase MazF